MTMAVGVRRRQFGCEYLGRLESVLVHTPGTELEMVREHNHRQLLFDTVADVPRFIDEHRAYCAFLAEQGVRVLQLCDYVSENALLMSRLPNLTYLHDVAVVTSRGAILSSMRGCRSGEETVVREALANLGIDIAVEFDDPGDDFEGCLLLSPNTLLVAHTERHSLGAICSFIPRALRLFKEVVLVDIPKARRYMHPDTIFGRVSTDVALAYPPAFERVRLYTNGGSREIDFLRFAEDRGMKIIPVSDFEQARLACTFVTIEPGKILHYDFALDRQTKLLLAKEGVDLVCFHSHALHAGGGSLRCLTMGLHRRRDDSDYSAWLGRAM